MMIILRIMRFYSKFCFNKIFIVFTALIFIVSLSLIFGLFYFVQAQASSADLIAVRIFPNPEHLTPSKWYQQNVPNPGSPALLEVDDYEAVQDGRTIYINGTNVVNDTDCPTGKCIYTNIYMLSYSEGAVAETNQVFQQILKNFEININLTNLKVCNNISTYYCTQGKNNCTATGGGPNQAACAGGDKDLCQLISCTSDLDCKSYASSPACEAEKDKLRRDTKRLSDIEEMSETISEYKDKTGQLPRLEAGTYLKEHSFSAWPSWQATLGNELGGSMPQDPINKFFGCRPPCCDTGTCTGELCPDPATCWDEEDLTLGCPRDAYLYGYSYDKVANAARIFYNVEYRRAEWKEQPVEEVAPGELLDILMVSKCAGGPLDGDDCNVDADCRDDGLPVEAKCLHYCFGYQGVTTDDFDGDEIPDTTDNCPFDANPLDSTYYFHSKSKKCNQISDAESSDDTVTANCQPDLDGDDLGDVCDPCPQDTNNDSDQDKICQGSGFHYPAIAGNDNCWLVPNPDQTDSDSDCPVTPYSTDPKCGDVCEACIDLDDDDICETGVNPDNCPGIYNPPTTAWNDYSGANHPASEQKDFDLDGLGDACDICPQDKYNDVDDDGRCGNIDNCPVNYNPGQEDFDLDASGCLYDKNSDGWPNDLPPYFNSANQCGGNACDEKYCGNGMIESPEICDGPGQGISISDQYQCIQCNSWTGGYCGDGIIQYQFGEICDCGADGTDADGKIIGNCTSTDTGISQPGTSEENQYQCVKNCTEWSSGWCGDHEIQATYDESCEEPGQGTALTDQYDCVDCSWDGGYCGDAVIQSWYGEDCDNSHGDIDNSSPDNQYSCTCLAGNCPTDDTQEMCKWTGGWCGDGIVKGSYGEQCENLNPIYNADVVFVFDTSGSMSDEAGQFCSIISTVVDDLESHNFKINFGVYSITNQFDDGLDVLQDCPNYFGSILDYYNSDSGIYSVNHYEDWGPAIYDVSKTKQWLEDYYRVIITFSDEGAQNGCNFGDSWNNADEEVLTAAIDIASAPDKHIIVNHILGLQDLCDNDMPSDAGEFIDNQITRTGGKLVRLSDVESMTCELTNIFKKITCTDDDGVMSCKYDLTDC